MKTELLYLEDTYIFKSQAKFLEMRENEKGKAVILDKTVFYPQGGGQPSDIGYIKNESGVFNVTFVGLDEEGIVWHFGEFESGSFTKDQEVSLEVNEDVRKLHARIHSAGHIIDSAIVVLGTNIEAVKGFHFSTGPYVECDGEVEDKEDFKINLENKVNELIDNSLSLQKENLTESEAKERNLNAPQGKDHG